MRFVVLTSVLALLAGAAQAQPPASPGADRFFATYKQLVETNTQFSNGDCTLAAQRMADRLRAAGFPADDVQVIVPPGHPKEGLMTAVLRGSDTAAKPILLLGHIDVVEARREDWTRDPYTLVVENGYVFGRGAVDMKLMDAIWVDTLIRLKEAGAPPRRTLKLALTCGEEGGTSNGVNSLNGASWLVANRPELVSAEFGLTEGAGGTLGPDHKPQFANLQVGQKNSVHFTLEVTNPGGHSSRPVPDNAIYRLSRAVLKVEAYRFPIRFNATTKAMFAVRAQESDPPALALRRLLKNPADKQADLAASADPGINNRLRTTCVATRLDAGHANNALPQRARATINCRIFPGESLDFVQGALVQAIGDPQVKVSTTTTSLRESNDPPLSPTVIDPAKRLVAKYFPTAKFVPMMSAPGTDALAFGAIHVPVYGAPGIFSDPDNGMHGLNERLPLSSVWAARDYLFELVSTYAAQPEGLAK